METNILSELQVLELTTEDEINVNGGGFFKYAGNLVIGALVSELLFEGVKTCCKDFLAGYNSTY